MPLYLPPSSAVSFSGGVSTMGNTLGNTGMTNSRLVFVGTNAVTLSQATNASGGTITFDAPVGAAFSAGVSTMGNTAGSTGVSGSRVVFVGSNQISLSQSTNASGATITFNGPAGAGANFSAGVSDLGNTAGSTGITGSRIVFVGTNNISLSQSTDANGATISFTPRALVTVSRYMPIAPQNMTSAGQSDATLQFFPMIVPSMVVTATRCDFFVSASVASTNAGTLSGTFTLSMGIYTKNASTLSLASSGSQSFSWSNSSNQGSLSFQSIRALAVPINVNITGGEYVIGWWMRTTSGSGNYTVAPMMAGSLQTTPFRGPWGGASNASHQMIIGLGISASSMTTAMPSAVDISLVKGGEGGGDVRIPFIVFANETY